LQLGKKAGRGVRSAARRQKIRLTSYRKTIKMTLCKQKKKNRKKGENMSRRVLDRKKRQNGFSVALVIMVILMLMVVISFKRYELKQKQEEYTQKEEQLLEQIAEEEERAEEIEEYRKYTQTQKYIEEVAKEKLGLVNENEIIFKEE
jgi:cell division protein DivIC